MTRPKGVAQVRLAQHRALAMAAFLDTVQPLEQTALGGAGMSQQELDSELCRQRADLQHLSCALRPAPRGRRKLAVTVYNLPLSGIAEMIRSVPLYRYPERMVPVAKKMAGAIRKNRGPRALTGKQLQSRIQNGFGDDRHLRRLRARLSTELNHAAAVAAIPIADSQTVVTAGMAALIMSSIRI